MNPSFPLSLLFLLSLICVIAAPSYAQPGGSNSDSGGKRVVMIAQDSDKEEIQTFIDAVKAQLSDLEVEFGVVWVSASDLEKRSIEDRGESKANEENTAAVFWCDLHRSDGPALFMSIPELDRVLVRRLGGVDAGGMPETTGIIVRASVDAILKGLSNFVYTTWMDLAELEKTLEASEALEAEQKRPVITIKGKIVTEAEKGERLLIGAAYALGMMASGQAPVHGVAGNLNLRIVGGLYGYLGYTAFPIYEPTGTPVYYKISRHVGYIGGRYSGSVGPIVDLGVSLGARVDYAVEEIDENEVTQSDTNLFSPKRSGTFWEVAMVPALDIGVEIAPRLRIFLLLGADILLYKQNFGYEDAEGQYVPLVTTWWVRPSAQLGLTLGLF